jgi:hypothetical protein
MFMLEGQPQKTSTMRAPGGQVSQIQNLKRKKLRGFFEKHEKRWERCVKKWEKAWHNNWGTSPSPVAAREKPLRESQTP